MGFKVFLKEELIMEGVLLIKSNPIGVALKDDNGVTKIIDGVDIAEVDGYRNFVMLRSFQKGVQAH